MAITQVADVVVPEVFTPYAQQITEEKSRLIASGAVVRDSQIDALLSGGGLTFNVPSWKDLANEEENVSNDDPTVLSSPKKTGTTREVGVRLSRNNSWGDADLTQALAGADPAASVAARVGYYWTQRLQAAFVAVMKGVFADNAAAPSGSEHTLNDLTNDISGASYSAGVTDFNAAAFIDAVMTLGDSDDDLSMVMVHSIVLGRMKKNNLIDFIPDSEGKVMFPTYQGKIVITDDHMPRNAGVFETWVFGPGAVRLGTGSPKVPTETKRDPDAGNGGGMSTLYNRVEWCLHPSGHKYAGTSPNGGPSNAATSNNLAHAGSWQRVFTERKQIKFARLITREF